MRYRDSAEAIEQIRDIYLVALVFADATNGLRFERIDGEWYLVDYLDQRLRIDLGFDELPTLDETSRAVILSRLGEAK